MTKSGIVLPDTAKEKPQEGEILAVGPGASSPTASARRSTSRSARRSCTRKYAGTEFKLEDEELLIVSQKDILAIVAG